MENSITPAGSNEGAESRKMETHSIPDHFQGNTLWLLIGACVVMVFFSVLEIRGFLARPTARTAYGEIREQLLPDGTRVVLNAHTDLDIDFKKDNSADREVWIKGEAWLDVKQTPGKSRFVIHTSPYDILVTGGKFDIVNRNNSFSVYVQEGNMTLKAGNINSGARINYKTGDFAALMHQRMVIKAVKENEVLAWKEKKISLSNSSLKELASVIETYYDVKVNLTGYQNHAVTVTGMLPNNNLETLLKALKAATALNFVRSNNEIMIKQQ